MADGGQEEIVVHDSTMATTIEGEEEEEQLKESYREFVTTIPRVCSPTICGLTYYKDGTTTSEDEEEDLPFGAHCNWNEKSITRMDIDESTQFMEVSNLESIKKVSNPKEFNWSIGQVALLNPADIFFSEENAAMYKEIDESMVESLRKESDTYFSASIILPSPELVNGTSTISGTKGWTPTGATSTNVCPGANCSNKGDDCGTNCSKKSPSKYNFSRMLRTPEIVVVPTTSTSGCTSMANRPTGSTSGFQGSNGISWSPNFTCDTIYDTTPRKVTRKGKSSKVSTVTESNCSKNKDIDWENFDPNGRSPMSFVDKLYELTPPGLARIAFGGGNRLFLESTPVKATVSSPGLSPVSKCPAMATNSCSQLSDVTEEGSSNSSDSTSIAQSLTKSLIEMKDKESSNDDTILSFGQ